MATPTIQAFYDFHFAAKIRLVDGQSKPAVGRFGEITGITLPKIPDHSK